MVGDPQLADRARLTALFDLDQAPRVRVLLEQ